MSPVPIPFLPRHAAPATPGPLSPPSRIPALPEAALLLLAAALAIAALLALVRQLPVPALHAPAEGPVLVLPVSARLA